MWTSDGEQVRYSGSQGMIVCGCLVAPSTGLNRMVGVACTPDEAGSALPGTGLGLVVNQGANLMRVGGQCNLNLCRMEGSLLAPTQVASGANVGHIQWMGRDDTTANQLVATVRAMTSENVTAAAHGGRLQFLTVLTGAAVMAVRCEIDGAGNLVAGVDNTYDVGTTGALRFRRVYAGTALQVEADGAAAVTSGLCLTSQVNQAAASVGTLTNAPAAGNPTFWLPVNVNGALKKMPCW